LIAQITSTTRKSATNVPVYDFFFFCTLELSNMNMIIYINSILLINNHTFHTCVHLIYPDELEIKKTKESDLSPSYLDILTDNYIT
jgi:hypothetical protein